MKKIFLCLLVLTLASCGKETPLTQTAKDDPVVKQQTASSKVAALGDTVAVDYVGKLEDGTIFDSSIKDMARKSSNFSEGRTYEPYMLQLKENGGSIEGFWKGIVGMKVGEKKTVTIAPEQAYGKDWISEGERIIDPSVFDATIVRKVKREDLQDVIKLTVKKSELGTSGQLPKVGEILTGADGLKAKVISIGESDVNLEIDNSKNPFSGKKIAIGTTAQIEGGNTATITALDATNVTLKISNKNNPFFGKELKAGLVGTYTDRGQTRRFTIKSISGKSMTISSELKNDSKLANKTLIFDLELKEIKSTGSGSTK